MLAEEHTNELARGYLDQNLSLLIPNPEVFLCHYLSRTSEGNPPPNFKIDLNNHLNGVGKEKLTYILLVAAKLKETVCSRIPKGSFHLVWGLGGLICQSLLLRPVTAWSCLTAHPSCPPPEHPATFSGLQLSSASCLPQFA